MIFVLELDPHRSESVLISVPDVVVPLVKVERPDDSPFQQSIAAMLQPGDFADGVFLFVPVAILDNVVSGMRFRRCSIISFSVLKRANCVGRVRRSNASERVSASF